MLRQRQDCMVSPDNSARSELWRRARSRGRGVRSDSAQPPLVPPLPVPGRSTSEWSGVHSFPATLMEGTMSIFAKKVDATQGPPNNLGLPPSASSPGKYGIADAIQLMRTLPVDHNAELIVRVVRATLASLNVHLAVIIDDASGKQKTIQDQMAAIHV